MIGETTAADALQDAMQLLDRLQRIPAERQMAAAGMLVYALTTVLSIDRSELLTASARRWAKAKAHNTTEYRALHEYISDHLKSELA